MIDLSIIIPHYNDIERLKKLVYTIPKLSNIQIVIVDDNSDDLNKIKKVIDDLSLKHNIDFYVNNKRKKGAGTCRNIGLSHAVGDWLLFADSDDYFTVNFFLYVKQYFISNFEVVFFPPESYDLIKKESSDRHIYYCNLLYNYNHKKKDSLLNIRYQFPVPWSKLFKKEFIIINQIEFEESIASNDVMFSTKVGYYMKRFTVDENSIYVVTKSFGSLTQNKNIDIFRSRLNTAIERDLFLRNNLEKKDYKKLRSSGRGFLINAIIFKYGLKEFIKTYKIIKKNNMRLLTFELLNPIIIIKKIKYQYKHIFSNRNYRK